MLNSMDDAALRGELLSCFGSETWVAEVARHRPFAEAQQLHAAAEVAWTNLKDEDWHVAFAALGEPEPAQADAGTVEASRVALTLYRQRFGMPFVSAARNATADELLMRIRIRLGNDAATEWRLACDEQRRITRARLQRLLTDGVA